MGRRKEALESIEEAVRIYRSLAKDDPTAFNAALAKSLGNMSARLSNMDMNKDALACSEEALRIHRALAEQDPGAFNDKLALSLYNLTLNYRHFEEAEKALSAITESSQLYEKLAVEYPAKFNEDYADALDLLGECLFDVGRDEEASEVEQKAALVRAAISDES